MSPLAAAKKRWVNAYRRWLSIRSSSRATTLDVERAVSEARRAERAVEAFGSKIGDADVVAAYSPPRARR